MKEIKDYLHVYLGCEYACFYSGCYHYEGDKITNKVLYELSGNFETQLFKLILRPLSDMTEDEKREYAQIGDADFNREFKNDIEKNFFDNSAWIKAEAYQTINLLAKHFDIFGLIEAGLAIDKTTLTNK